MSIINVDSISDAAGTGSPSFPNGMSLNSLTATGDVTAKNFIGSESNPAITSADADGYLGISGDATVATGGNIRLFSAAHATNANNILFRNNTTTALKYDSSATKWNFQANDVTTTGTVAATSYTGDGSALTGIGTATAGLAAGAVGTYAYLVNTGIDTSISQGTSIAGSSLRYSGHSNDSLTTSTDNWSVSHTAGGANPSGTWQSMGSRGTSVGRNYFQTLFLRIS